MEILSYVDHTLLSQTATFADIRTLIDDAVHFGTASVCIPPCFVKEASEYAGGKIAICTVIGFPNGYNTTETKIFEAGNALANGADELDVVINIGDLKSRRYDRIKNELSALKSLTGEKTLKVIIETCLLTDEEKIKMCEIVTESGADYIKTSTGFSKGGATPADVILFKEHVGKNVKIKAAGGIRSIEDAENYLKLGASRLGTSAIVKIYKERENE